MEPSLIETFPAAGWILFCLGLYLVVVVVVGIGYSRNVRDSDDLAVCGRQMSLVFLVPSIVATWICAGAMMGAAGAAMLYGMQGVLFDPWAPALGMVLVGLLFAFRMRKARYTTLTDFFEHRFGRFSAVLYTITQVLSAIAWLGGQLVAMGIIVHLTTGLSMQTAVFMATLAIIIATTCGGLWALSRIDAMGFVLIVAGLVVLLPFALGQAGGLGDLLATGRNWSDLPTWSMTIESEAAGGYLGYVGLLAVLLYISAWITLSVGDVPSQVLMQRALAARNERTAVTGFVLSGILYLVLGMIPVLIGIAIFTSGMVEGVTDIEGRAEHILPWAAYQLLPAWASTLFIVSLAAAIVSTCGDNALIVSTLIGHNLYRMFRPRADRVEVLRVIRVAIPIVGVCGMAIALYAETVYRLIVLSGGIQLATICAAYILGTFWRKANRAGAVSSFLAGLISWVVLFRYWALPATDFSQEDAIFIAVVPAAVLSFATLIVVSLATQRVDPPRPMRTSDGADMSGMPGFFWSRNHGNQGQAAGRSGR
jgi:solute:Na+ symporter, SSS family